MKKVYLYLLLFCFLIAFIFIPFNLVISNEKYFQVTDENGVPLKNCIVEHKWIQYALEYREREMKFADEYGYVYLPKRTVKTSWAELIRASYIKLKIYGVHASFSSEDVVVISAPGFQTEIIYPSYWNNKRIFLRKKQPY